MNCKICGMKMVLAVLHNHSGWYIGYVCNVCGPQTRETDYYITEEAAEYAYYL